MNQKRFKKLKETKEESRMLKNKNGITLIALVVTMVVLLILAGVSISLILDNNGIIKKSKDARREYRQAQTNEQADLDNASDWIDDATAEKVEPENISDWEYTEEDDGTITLTSYKGTETTVVFPNYINGKKVKKISGDTTGSDSHKARYFSIWNKGICNTTNTNDSTYGYVNKQGTITKVIISSGIEEIEGRAFEYSHALEEIIIPETVNMIGEGAFVCCSNLKKISIPKKIEKLEANIFYDCGNIESIIIPENVKRIESMAFSCCTKLVDIQIPKTVEYIGESAFMHCKMLINITIPRSVTTMGSSIFSGIPSITVNVPFKKGETPEGWDADWNKTIPITGYNVTVNYLK